MGFSIDAIGGVDDLGGGTGLLGADFIDKGGVDVVPSWEIIFLGPVLVTLCRVSAEIGMVAMGHEIVEDGGMMFNVSVSPVQDPWTQDVTENIFA